MPSSGIKPGLLRKMTVRRVLECLQEHGPLSRADLTRETGISAPTVSKAVADLLESGLLEEGMAPDHALGRPGKKLQLAHGIVSHKKEEWSVVGKVRVYSNAGSRLLTLKKGTEVADGAWPELKQCVPSQLHSSMHARIADYVFAWAWGARRHGMDLFKELGSAFKTMRE